MTAQNRYVMLTPQVDIDGTDLSDYVRSVTAGETAAEITSSASGDTWMIRHAGGLKDGGLTLEMYQSFVASQVYDTLKDLLGTNVTVKVKPKEGAPSATNPERTYTCYVTALPFLEGTVFETPTINITWPFAAPPTTNP